MRVFAVDPGYGRCGVAIMEKQNDKEVLIFSDCIETSSKDPFVDRLVAVINACDLIINKYSPNHVAIEKLFFSTNQKTAMQVAEVRGAIIGLAGIRDIAVSEYTPAQIKNVTAGSGSADKKSVIKMIRILIKIEKEIKYDDEYDAIAVGITHLACARR